MAVSMCVLIAVGQSPGQIRSMLLPRQTSSQVVDLGEAQGSTPSVPSAQKIHPHGAVFLFAN